MHLSATIVLLATFIIPIFGDDADPAIPAGDIPTTCLVTCAPVIAQANTCQVQEVAAAPAGDDKRRWFGGFKRDDDDPPTTADPCICHNATFAVNTLAPPCDDCIQANGATTTAVNDLIENCKLPAAAVSGAVTVTVTAAAAAATAVAATSVGSASNARTNAGDGISSHDVESRGKSKIPKRSTSTAGKLLWSVGYVGMASLVVIRVGAL